MSVCKKQGKDEITFVTKEDHEKPLLIELPEDDDDQPGVLLPNGDINWNCPCLGGVATGPCGVEFRKAFSCFQYSKETPKGSDCFETFNQMQQCMVQYPNLYPQPDDPMEFEGDESHPTKTIEDDESHTAKTTDVEGKFVENSETKPS